MFKGKGVLFKKCGIKLAHSAAVRPFKIVWFVLCCVKLVENDHPSSCCIIHWDGAYTVCVIFSLAHRTTLESLFLNGSLLFSLKLYVHAMSHSSNHVNYCARPYVRVREIFIVLTSYYKQLLSQGSENLRKHTIISEYDVIAF